MPEFEQTKQLPYAKIIVRLEQPFTAKTKSAWFPFRSHWGAEKKVWVSCGWVEVSIFLQTSPATNHPRVAIPRVPSLWRSA
jgi:hypothetical protein